tara:strand:- start:8517 stop:8897 length:381 start_codon:yes stop_codon:yes gene_type:complete
MLEDPRMIIQIGTVLVTLAGGWALIKAALRTAQRDIANIESVLKENMTDLHGRVDQIEQDKGVLIRQAEVFATILSPNELRTTHREMGALLNRVSQLEATVMHHKDVYDKSHNNSHKYVPPPKGNS